MIRSGSACAFVLTALWGVSVSDGKKVAELRIDSPPVWDGMAASGGRLYLSTLAGEVLCVRGD